MKAQSTFIPSKVTVDKIGEMAHINFFINAREIEIDNETLYEYDNYSIQVPYRDGLIEDIDLNFNEWLNFAISLETTKGIQQPTLEDKVAEQELVINDLVNLLVDKGVIY